MGFFKLFVIIGELDIECNCFGFLKNCFFGLGGDIFFLRFDF